MRRYFDCGISTWRIDAWLSDELALKREGSAWVYREADSVCQVKTEPLESRILGTVALERTALSVEGEDAAVASFERAFTLRFMSAGG